MYRVVCKACNKKLVEGSASIDEDGILDFSDALCQNDECPTNDQNQDVVHDFKIIDVTAVSALMHAEANPGHKITTHIDDEHWVNLSCETCFWFDRH